MIDTQDGDEPKKIWETSGEALSFYFVVFLSILALVLVLSSLLHKSRLAHILPEAGLTLAIGLMGGILIACFGDADQITGGLLSFNSEVFFVFLLPPIIFNSGYHINKITFLRYFQPIALLACLGTAVSTLVVGFTLNFAVQKGYTQGFEPSLAEMLTFGALISATDPVSTLAVFQQKHVDPQLFYLVFGESVLNDAVGVVLFNTMKQFIGNETGFNTSTVLWFLVSFTITFVGSMILGLLSGIVAAYLLKIADLRETRLLELSSYVLVMYAPFFAAEVLPLSGIITALFTGIAAKQYAHPNLTDQSAEGAVLIFRLLAHMAETSLFLELGLSVFGLAFGNFHLNFVLFAILGCLLGRLVNVYPITICYNFAIARKQAKRDRELSEAEQPLVARQKQVGQKIYQKTAHMLWFSGLRGCVAYACARSFPDTLGNREPMVVTTMAIVLLTVFLLGGATEWALDKLDIEMNVNEAEFLKEELATHEDNIIDKIEKKYFLPCLIRDYEAYNANQTPASTDVEDNSDAFEGESRGNHGNDENEEGMGERQDSLYDFGLFIED